MFSSEIFIDDCIDDNHHWLHEVFVGICSWAALGEIFFHKKFIYMELRKLESFT